MIGGAWLSAKTLWLAIGFTGQAAFFGRFLVQWIVSEREKRSTIPLAFWYFSITGGLILLVYAIHLKDPVFILGQSTGLFIYVRNLVLIREKRPSSGLMDNSMRLRLFLVVGLCTVLAGAMLVSRGVWAPDEARYAEVAREMKETGAWLVPILNGETYAEKPPLFFALIRIFSAFSEGIPEWAAKAPSLLAALGTLLLTGWLGMRLCGRQAAWLAPLVLGTTGKFAWQAQFGQIDMVLAFLVTAQICLGLLLANGELAALPGISWSAVLGFAGVLAKGPAGCVFPWIILAAFFSARRDWRALGRTGLPWIILAVVLLSAAWLAAAGFVAGWGYPETLLFRQTLTRYLDPWHHQAPWYFYLLTLLADGLPYSLFLVPLAFALWKTKAWKEPAVLLPLCWIATYLVLFSASAGKRSVYMLPVFPAVALLLARGVRGWSDGTFGRGGFRAVQWVLAMLTGLGLAYAIPSTPGGFGGFLPYLLAGGLLALASCIASLFLSSRPHVAISALAAGMALLVLVAAVPGIRRLDSVKRPLPFVSDARAALRSGGRVGVFPALVPSANFYFHTATPLFRGDQQAQASAFLASFPSNLLLVQEGKWKGASPPHRLVRRGPIGGDRYELWAPALSAEGQAP